MAPVFPRPHPILLLGLLWGLALLIPTLGLSQNYMKVQGRELPSWCLLDSVPTITVTEDRLQLFCSSACGRSANCSFFCYNSEVCNIFYGQMAPYFRNFSGLLSKSISYDACFTTWKGDKLNILTPEVEFFPEFPGYITSPQIVKDGLFCGKGSEAYRSIPSQLPHVVFDFGEERKVSHITHYVYDVVNSASLIVTLGNEEKYVLNDRIYIRPGVVQEGTIEVCIDKPPKFGRYLAFYRSGGTFAVPLILGELTVYE